MEEILESRMLEFEKSSFIIDLKKNAGGKLYIAIEQIVRLQQENFTSAKINLNPSVVDDIVEVLKSYSSYIGNKKSTSKKYF